MSSSFVYASVAEMKTQLDKTGAGDDAGLLGLLTEASRAIDNFCNRPDGFRADSSASARLYSGSGTPVLWIDECVAVTEVAVKGDVTDDTYTAWSVDDWLVATGEPRYPDFNRLPRAFLIVTPTGSQSHFVSGAYSWRRGFSPNFEATLPRYRRSLPTVRVTARWGYSDDTPGPIKQATITIASRWWKRGQSGWADTIANADAGVLMYRKEIDPDVQFMLSSGRYVRAALGAGR